MKLLLDANLSPHIAEALRKAGATISGPLPTGTRPPLGVSQWRR